MALLTLQDAGDGLSAVSFAAANAGGDVVPAGTQNAGFELDGVLLLVNNASVGAINVTVRGVVTSVSASSIGVIPVNVGVYPGTEVAIAYSAVASVTVAAVRI